MSISRSSKCFLPFLLKQTSKNRTLPLLQRQQRPLLLSQLKPKHFRFLTTTATTTTTDPTDPTTSTHSTTSNIPDASSTLTKLQPTPEPTDSLDQPPKYTDPASVEQAWQDYCNLPNPETTFSPDEFHELGRAIKFHGGTQSISRIQILLGDLNKRRHDDARYQQTFDELCGMLIHLFGRMEDMDSARIVLDGLIATSPLVRETTIMTMVDVIKQHGTKRDLYELCQTMREKDLLPVTPTGCARLIHTFNTFEDVNSSRYYFADMVKRNGLEDSVCRAMMQGMKLVKDVRGMLDLYDKMKQENMTISIATYTLILSTLKHHEGWKIKKGIVKREASGFERVLQDLRASGQRWSASTYLVMETDPKEALKQMDGVDIRDYNVFLHYYTKRNQYEDAFEIYKRIKGDERVRMDKFTYGILLDLMVKSSDDGARAAFDVFEEMKVNAIEPDATTFTSLLYGCNRLGDLNRAVGYLREMSHFGVEPNVFSFNSILDSIYGARLSDKERWGKVKQTWKMMESYQVDPDVRSYNIYLSTLAKLLKPIQNSNNGGGDFGDNGSWLGSEREETAWPASEIIATYRMMKTSDMKSGITPDFVTYVVVINALCKAGQLRPALKVYDDSKMTDYKLLPNAYNHIMAALEKAGKPSEAMNIWHDMRLHGVLPDNKSYEIILDVCDQMGLADTLSMIREQRRHDMDRLVKLEEKRQYRMQKSFREQMDDD